MISKENRKREIVLIELSMMATCHGCPNQFNTKLKSASATTQLITKIILNLVCDNGDEAI